MTTELANYLDGAPDIATSDHTPVEIPLGSGQDETEPVHDPKWEACLNALLDEWSHPDPARAEVPPRREAIEAAVTWLQVIRSHRPMDPPSLITAEPAGGLIVEHRGRADTGEEVIAEFTFYNEGRAEFTLFLDTNVVLQRDIDFRAPGPLRQ